MYKRSVARIIAVAGLALTTLFIGSIQVRGQTPEAGQLPAASALQATPVDPGSSSGSGDQAGTNSVPMDIPAPGAGMNAQSTSVLTWNKSMRYPGSTLRPRADDVDYTASGGGGCIYASSGNAYTVWNLPVNLPEGVQVQWLRIYYNDTNAADSNAWFTVYNTYGGLAREYLVSSKLAAGYGYYDVAINPAETIDYNQYSYVLNWYPGVLGTSMQLCGLQLYYLQSSSTYLPAVTK